MNKIDRKKLSAMMPADAPGKSLCASTFDIISSGGKFSALVATQLDSTLDWTDAQDDEEQHLTAIGRDGYGYDHKYVMWGTDNLMPVMIADKIGKDETVNSSLDALKRICYGSGVKLCSCMGDEVDGKLAQEEAQEWLENNDLPLLSLTQAKNYKMFYWNLDVVVLNNMGDTITDIYTRDVENVRLHPHLTDSISWGTLKRDKGTIPFAYYGKFNCYQDINVKNAEIIPLLTERAPLRDLQVLMGRERNPKTGLYECDDPTRPSGVYGDVLNYPICRVRKFGILRRVPSNENRFYPVPTYGAIIKGAWYNIKKAIEVALKAKIHNGTQIKYVVTIHPSFWMGKLNEEGIVGGMESKEGKAMKARILKSIEDYLIGAENANKSIITGMALNTISGDYSDMIKVSVIDNKTQGGDWAEDITEATNMICYGMGIHPSLVGAVPGKSGNNNSGSDKRELYTIAQANEMSTRDIMLMNYQIVLKYDGWWKRGVRCSMPFMQLTTLDEHVSAKEVEPTKSNE